MSLPINIEDLVHGKTIEWESLEFKQGLIVENVLYIGVDIGAKGLIFNSLDEIIAFSNQAARATGEPAITVISAAIHERVPEMLSLLLNKLKRGELPEAKPPNPVNVY